MWALAYKESWVLKKWCFWTVVLEKTLESPLDSKEIKPVNPKGNQSWIFIGRTNAKVEAPVLMQRANRWKRPWCWERFSAGEGGDRGWDCWIESSTKWTWVWANSRRQWRIGKPGVLLSMGSQNQTWPNDRTTTLTLCFEGGAPKSLQIVAAAMKVKDTCSLEEKLWPT